MRHARTLTAALAVAVLHAQAVAVDRVDVRLERVDQRDVGPAAASVAADRAAERAGAEEADLHAMSLDGCREECLER